MILNKTKKEQRVIEIEIEIEQDVHMSFGYIGADYNL
jgi:hypothetical protein